jgi:adenylate cyclase class IV
MLHAIDRTLHVGSYVFPTRDDYLAYYAPSRLVDDLNEEAIIAIQRDWHTRGQNGCVFAMHAARKLSAEQWRYEIHRNPVNPGKVRQAIASAVADQANEILSLIFPAVERSAELRHLVAVILAAGCRQADAPVAEPALVALRYQIYGAESWIVGFAPTPSLPATRRAPFAELAIRTKPKSGPTHPKLNNDMTQAHLADIDLGFDPEVTTRLIAKSITRTASMLGGTLARSRAKGAKAKVTYDLSSTSLATPESEEVMRETEMRLGLPLEQGQQLKPTLDAVYTRKSVVNRVVIVKVDNNDFSSNPATMIDIKTKLIGDQTLLSVKHGSWHGDTAREEYEINFRREDLPSLLAVLVLFGYTKFIVLATVRTTWLGVGVVITLDEYSKLGQALFEVELSDATASETLIEDVFADLGLIPMNSEQTISFIGGLNECQEIQVDLTNSQPAEIAGQILAEHC